MAGIIHTTVPMNITRRRLMTGTIGVFAGVATGRAVLAQTGSATPEAETTLEGGPERIHSLLAMIPESFGVQSAVEGVVFYYADLKRQLESVGVSPYEPGSDSVPAGYTGALIVLATASIGFQYGLEPEFVSTFGFSALQAEESLSVGSPPNDLTIFRGGLPIADLPSVWEASGYARETTDTGVDIWTAGREGDVDLTSNVSRYGVGALNNVAIFDDTVVFGRFFTDVELVAKQVAEPGPSVVDGAGLTDLLSTLAEETVSAIAVTGSFLNLNSLLLPEQLEETSALIEESDANIGAFPEPESAIFAITGGTTGPDFVATGEGTPAASPVGESTETDGGVVQVRLQLTSEDDAATAVAAVEYRWNALSSARMGAPFTELMTIITAEPDPIVGTVAAIDFREVQRAGTWIDIVLSRDLVPFAWVGDLPVEASPTAAG